MVSTSWKLDPQMTGLRRYGSGEQPCSSHVPCSSPLAGRNSAVARATSVCVAAAAAKGTASTAAAPMALVRRARRAMEENIWLAELGADCRRRQRRAFYVPASTVLSTPLGMERRHAEGQMCREAV
jgi:hypothetical protein